MIINGRGRGKMEDGRVEGRSERDRKRRRKGGWGEVVRNESRESGSECEIPRSWSYKSMVYFELRA